MGVCFYVWQHASAASQLRAFSCPDILFTSKNPKHPRASHDDTPLPRRPSPQLCPICAFPAARSCSSCDAHFCHSHLYACPDCDIRLCSPCLNLHHLDGHWSDSDTTSTLHLHHRTFHQTSHTASPTCSPRHPLFSIQPTTHATRTPQRPLLYIQPTTHAARIPRHPLFSIRRAINLIATHFRRQPVSQPTIGLHPVPAFSHPPIHLIVNPLRSFAPSSHSPADQHINAASLILSSPLHPAMTSSFAPNTPISIHHRSRNRHPHCRLHNHNTHHRLPQLPRRLLSQFAGLFASLARAAISLAAISLVAVSNAAVSRVAISHTAVSHSAISPAEACA